MKWLVKYHRHLNEENDAERWSSVYYNEKLLGRYTILYFWHVWNSYRLDEDDSCSRPVRSMILSIITLTISEEKVGSQHCPDNKNN